MEIGKIISFSLIGIGALAVIILLVYTKIIKPSTFGYTSQSFFVKRKSKKIFDKLIKDKKLIKGFSDVLFDSNDLTLAAIDYIYFGNEFIYLISNPLYWNIKNIEEDKGSLVVVTSRCKKLTLPLDIEVFIKAIKNFKKLFSINKNLIIIIPCLNKEFKNTRFNEIDFIKLSDIDKFIISKEQSLVNTLEVIQQSIISKMKKSKNKRRLFPKFIK